MLRCCGHTDIARVVDYIGEESSKCFYLYLDLLNYGTGRRDMGLWVSEHQGEIQGAAYRYFSTLHLYSRETFPQADAVALIQQLDPSCITGPQSCIDGLPQELLSGNYQREENFIVTAKTRLPEPVAADIKPGQLSDIEAIAAMMLKSKTFSSVYRFQELCGQMRDRILSGNGRSFIIRDEGGNIAAANATYAETKDMAIVSGLITSEKHRHMGYGSRLTAGVWNMLYDEGKTCYAFLNVENANTVSLHRRVGCIFEGKYIRLLRNR